MVTLTSKDILYLQVSDVSVEDNLVTIFFNHSMIEDIKPILWVKAITSDNTYVYGKGRGFVLSVNLGKSKLVEIDRSLKSKIRMGSIWLVEEMEANL